MSKPSISDLEIKKGTRALFVTQIFSTLSYSILYSTLVLYGNDKLHLSPTVMNTLMGSYLAFNFGLHFLGGYMGVKVYFKQVPFCDWGSFSDRWLFYSFTFDLCIVNGRPGNLPHR